MKRILSMIPFLTILFSACAQSKTYEEKLKSLYRNTVPQIKAKELKKEMENNPNLIILDTRAEAEYKVSHIKNAKFIDYNSFKIQDLQNISKEAQIVVYCSVGYRSERIGEKLKKAGFKNVLNLYGGIFQWVNEENPVYDSENQATEKVHTYNKKWSVWLENGEKVY